MPTDSPRVLVVLSSANRRGAEIEGLGLADELVRRDVRTEAVAIRPATEGSALDVAVIGDGSPRSLQTIRELRQRARRHDVVIGYGSVTLPALAIATLGLRTQFVYRSIGNPVDWSRGEIHRRRTGWLFRRADHVVALFDGAATAIQRLYRVPADQITVIPNARDVQQFGPASPERRERARTRFGLPANERVVAQVGSLSPEKRVPVGIESVALLDDVHMLVVGTGPELHAVEDAARSAPGRIHLTGRIDDPVSAYHAADVVLLTSRTEGMPGSLIEAGMCGVPFVATDVGAVASMAGPYDIVIPSDAHASEFQACLGRSLSMETDPLHVSRRAVELYSWDRVLPMWVDLLNTLHRVHERA